MLAAVVADYAREGHRGRVAGLMGFSTGCGACFGALVLAKLTTRLGVKITFWVTSALMACGALTVFLGMGFAPNTAEQAKERCWWKRILLGFQLVRSNPLLLVAYAGGFVARGDSVILPVFLPAWVSAHVGTAEKSLTASLVGTCNLMALLGAPLMGWLGDRVGRRRLMLSCALTSAAAYSCMPFLPSPRSALAFLCVAVQGFAQIGTIITSMSLVAGEAPINARGAVAGVYSLWGALGIVTVGKGGARMGEVLQGGGPFLLMAAGNVALLLIGLFIGNRTSNL